MPFITSLQKWSQDIAAGGAQAARRWSSILGDVTAGTATASKLAMLGASRELDYLAVTDFVPGLISNRLVSAAAATLAVTAALHDGKIVVLNRAAGVTATLPAATGSGSLFKFVVGTTVTSNNDIIQVANATDIMAGVASIVTDTSGILAPTAADSDTITMNGTTSGGVQGGIVELMDIASGVWAVRASLLSTGVEITPFSAAVS